MIVSTNEFERSVTSADVVRPIPAPAPLVGTSLRRLAVPGHLRHAQCPPGQTEGAESQSRSSGQMFKVLTEPR